MAPTHPSFNQQAAVAADPSGAVRGMGDLRDCSALGPDSSSRHHCCWPTRTTTTTASRKELIVAPLEALIGLQARQGGSGLEQRLCCATSSSITTTTVGSSTELLSAESALPVGTSGSRGSSASTRRLRVPRGGGGGRRDAQYEEDDINSGGGGVGGGILQRATTTIDLIQIPALLAATTVVSVAAVDRSCNRISKADEATDHRLLFQTTNNVALEEEDMDTDTTERINNRTRIITANTDTPPLQAATAPTRGRPVKRSIDGVHYKLDSKLAPSRSKIRISHCNVSPTALGSRDQVNGFPGQGSVVYAEELISNNVIKNGNHKYCYETRNSTRTMKTRKTVATPSRLLTAVVLFIMAHVNMVTVWADTSLGK